MTAILLNRVENGEILFNQNDLLDYEVLEEPILQTVYKPKNQ